MTWIGTCSIPIKDRSSYLYLDRGNLDVEDRSLVLRYNSGGFSRLPVAALTCLMLGPGSSITHEAVKLAADVKCLLLWVGEEGVRLYSAGMPGGHRCDRLLTQAKYALDQDMRTQVVREMYQYRFTESFDNLSIEQMRGKEASRVKNIYRTLSDEYGVEWNGRRYDAKDWRSADTINRAISTATSCLYGLSEAAILISGYSPAIGFIHYGRPRSFVYDVADLLKYETVVPVAFESASASYYSDSLVRQKCRDMFQKEHILDRLVPLIESFFHDNEDVPGIVEPPLFSEKEGEFYSGADS